MLFLARWGWKEIALFGLLWTGLGVGAFFLFKPIIALPALLLLWTLWFFRDPERRVPAEPGLLVSPADGTVTEVSRVPRTDFFDEPATRIGIFLSVFNVHVNRAPCDGVVKTTRYTPGKFLDARHPDSGAQNESNAILLDRGPDGPILVRQVAGAIARRIVCAIRPEDKVERGQRIGMIKFGSRTELYVPERVLSEVAVKIGDTVKGGETILARTR
jgi:phosphatidylserine decarboxylase